MCVIYIAHSSNIRSCSFVWNTNGRPLKQRHWLCAFFFYTSGYLVSRPIDILSQQYRFILWLHLSTSRAKHDFYKLRSNSLSIVLKPTIETNKEKNARWLVISLNCIFFLSRTITRDNAYMMRNYAHIAMIRGQAMEFCLKLQLLCCEQIILFRH